MPYPIDIEGRRVASINSSPNLTVVGTPRTWFAIDEYSNFDFTKVDLVIINPSLCNDRDALFKKINGISDIMIAGHLPNTYLPWVHWHNDGIIVPPVCKYLDWLFDYNYGIMNPEDFTDDTYTPSLAYCVIHWSYVD